MATIDSVELYLSRTSNRTGWYIQVDIHDVGEYTDNPTLDTLLGSKRILVDTVPTHGSQDWITFTFGTPISMNDDGFFAIHVWCDTSNYQAAGLYWYESDDWDDATGGAPLAGDERFWTRDSGGSWTAGNSGAYRINCSGTSDNQAESPLGTYDSFGGGGSSYGHGVRTYLIGLVLPSKPTNPTPANSATEVDWSAKGLSWDDGGGADTYDVYFGLTGALALISSAQAGTSITVDNADIPFPAEGEVGAVFYWRIDATNNVGTTTGDEWNFDARPAKASNPSPTNAFGIMTLDWMNFGWDEVITATTYDVYAGTETGEGVPESNMELIVDDNPLFTIAQSYLLTAMNLVYPNTGMAVYDYTYYWQVNTKNEFGVTVGDFWSFDTIAYEPPRISYILIIGGSGAGPYDDPPGVEGTDWNWTGESGMMSVRRLIVAANDSIWYEVL